MVFKPKKEKKETRMEDYKELMYNFIYLMISLVE
jgi:hypothetical protein